MQVLYSTTASTYHAYENTNQQPTQLATNDKNAASFKIASCFHHFFDRSIPFYPVLKYSLLSSQNVFLHYHPVCLSMRCEATTTALNINRRRPQVTSTLSLLQQDSAL